MDGFHSVLRLQFIYISVNTLPDRGLDNNPYLLITFILAIMPHGRRIFLLLLPYLVECNGFIYVYRCDIVERLIMAFILRRIITNSHNPTVDRIEYLARIFMTGIIPHGYRILLTPQSTD